MVEELDISISKNIRKLELSNSNTYILLYGCTMLSVGTEAFTDEKERPSNRFPFLSLANVFLLLCKWVECSQINPVLI